MEEQKPIQNIHPQANWQGRGQSFANLLKMGHCAPTVMQTLLDVSSLDKEWMVKLSAGMPGGIGNTGFECGAFTSSLALMGVRDGSGQVDRDLPAIFDKGHALCQNFLACHGTLNCKAIRGKDRFPRHCLSPVLRSPELYLDALDGSLPDAIPADTRAGYSRLYAHMAGNDFHCAQFVLLHLGYTPAEVPELFDTASAFMGGTLFMGKTCSAFAAGVMAIGLRSGEIEDSPLRVIRMLAIMTVGGNAFDEKINKFNGSMNRGFKLSRWFTKEYGSTQCQEITNCDFSDLAGVNKYIEGGCITKCKQISEKVAIKVQTMIST